MSNDTVMTVTVKGIGDFSDVVSNVGSVQKALTKLKLPDKLGDSLNKNITNFYKEYEKYQKKISEGIKTQGDYNQVEKSLNNMRNLYQAIGKDAQKLTELDMKDILNLDTGEFKKIMDEMTSVMKQIGSVKIDTSPFTKAFKDIQGITKNSKIVGEDGLLNKIIGSINTGQIAEAKKQLQELQNYAKKVASRTTADGKQAPGTLSPEKYQQLTSAINSMNGAVSQAETAINPLIEKHNNLQKELDETKQKAAQSIKNEFKGYNQASGEVEKLTDSLRRMHEEEFNFNREAQNIDRQIQSYFGLSQMIRKVGDIAKDAFATVKELDKAMTETAVVTNFSVGDMWDMLPTYTAQANQLGSTIKDVYEAATLYYQQGLNTNQAMGLANETLKMARIAGLGAAEATDMMTAALRGFNMEINQQSAQKINDIYSELAAITASDTAEIGSAMERTASIANSANMEFATTSAFLAQMIETTREAPENLGTAMKTIVARFQEMKQDPTKLIDSEGVAMDANKVDKALKTIGVNLMNTKGEFRDLDDVFLDISQRWDSLTQGQQRYIATIAAGSRQQSRFIAMMSNYERTMELVDAANNSAGASQRQFEKTLDSMEAKLNKLKNAWDQFTMGLMNNQILKFGVDALTEGFTIVNKFIDILGKLPPKPFEGITKSALTLITTLGMLNFGKRATRGLVMGGAGWFKGETSLVDGFKQGWKSSGQTGFFKNKKSTVEAEQQGVQDGQAYGKGWARAVQILQTKQKTGQGILSQTLGLEQFKKNKAAFGSDSTILNSLFPKGGLDDEARRDAQDYLNTLRQELNNGKITKEQLPTLIESGLGQQKGFDNKYVEDVAKGLSEKKIKAIGLGFDGMTSHINSAGVALSNFGSILQGTPLEPFGQIIGTVGGALISLSTILATTKAGFLEQWAAATVAAVGEETEAGAALTAAAANGTLTVSSITAAGGMATLATAIGAVLLPLLAIAAIIGVVVGAYKLLDAAIETNKEKIESATDAAAAASEAYDSAKQETSELSDAIEQVKTNEDAFDGLVVGTAAFNEQLVTANDQIMELIKKYPMLNDYLTTDKNGLMHISDEGLNAVKDYQKQLQANASALNLIQTADLNSIETQQKAKQMRKTKGTDTLESLAQRRQEADLIEQQAEAQQQMAKLNAVNTALVDKEIGNREKVSAILADQYDSRREAINLEGESIHDLKQEYADFYGYKYDKSTKKMTDIEGNEIDVDKATVKDAVKDIRILTDIEVDGKSLDNMINHIDSTFSQALGSSFEESGSLFSDILSDNIDIEDDLLQNLLTNPDKLQSAVDSLSEKEIAAVLGVSADAVEQAPAKYKDELTDKLTEKATNIAETQAQSYADLATMLAQTTSADVSQLIDASGQATTNAQKANQQAIKEQLEKLTSEQKNTLSSIGNILNENAGAETMRTFIKQAADIYTKGTKESITALDTIIKDVNWSSPTARLKAYNDMINSTDKDVQNLGNSLRKSSESSNLLGEAFEEFYDSSDFQEMAENMDKFADSSGKLNASSIQEMAKECNSLNNLLDTGAISAGGVAAALNAMGRDGNITILDLNENLLKFLSTANQLDDVLSEAHSLIENFDWGVDTGESEDFAKDSTKKWKELYDNGEFGNQQLENYAKFVLGQERWNDELEKSGGNIETALNNMSGDILKYSDGFEQAWLDMANSSKIKDVHYDDNGDIIWDTKGKTTQELVDWLAETRGITQEWAKLMVEDFANYSYDFKTELANNDYTAALKNGDYIEAHKGADNTTNITQSEVAALAAAQNKTEEEILKDIQKYGKVSEDELNVIKNIDENGNLLMGNGDIASLNKQYSQAELGKDTDKSWISQYLAQTRQGQTIEGSTDLKAAISGAIADGLPDQQATEMARAEAYQAFKDGAQVFYDGVELNEQDLADSQAFAEKIAEITENSRWNTVGEAIAQGYISYIKGNEDLSNSSENWTSAKDVGDKGLIEPIDWSSGTDADIALREEMRAKARENWSQLWSSIKEAFTSGTPIEDPKVAAAEQSKEHWKEIWVKVKEAFTSGEGTEDPKIEAANKAKENWKALWDKIKEAFTNNPDINIDPKVNKNNQPSQSTQPETTETTGELKVTYTGTIANADQLKSSLEQQITSLLNTIASQQSKISATATVNVKQGTIEKPKTQKAVVDYTKGKQAKAEKQTATVDYKLGTQAVPKAKTALVNYTLGSQAAPKAKTVDISPHFVGSWEKTITLKPSGAKGINNTIPVSSIPNLGSLAKGSRYGRLGPKGKGGLTLTGEKGFEIAWLPSESRSMILGAEGPQMINLPADAVVYTHEQSKDILKKRQTIDAGSHAGRHTKGGGKSKTKSKSSSKKKKSKKKSKKKKDKTEEKEITPTINNFSIEEAVQFNIDQTLARITEEISLKTQEIEKNLEKIGTTYNDIASSTKAQEDALKNVKDNNNALIASYQRQLADYRAQQTYISWTDANGESQRNLINLGSFVTAQGAVDTNAILAYAGGNRALQESIFKEVSGVANGIVNGMEKAKKAIADADNQLAELGKKVSEAFFQWENELTQVYNLTQRIDEEISLTDRFSSQVALELAKLNAGFGTTANVIENIRKTLIRNNETLRRQIKDQQQLITARKIELDQAMSSVDEEEKLKEYNAKTDWISEATKVATIEFQKQQVEGAQKAANYVKELYKDLDGSIRYQVDWEQIEEDKNAGLLTSTTYEAIKEKIDELNEASTTYNNTIKDATDLIAEQYDKLREYQDTIGDFEDTLIDGLEEIKKNELDTLKDISGSISDALSDLLDEVKRRLEERRQREDNLKTEQDISRKQQRLAALRANTASGNQVEIAQLEKELAEAQQSYQRTLEDQLLNRLQQQGDEAARQRERQIELLEAQTEINSSTNKELVALWLKDPETYKQEIFEVWKKANNYESKGEVGQHLLEQTFESGFAELVTAVEQTGFDNHFQAIEGDLNTLIGLIQNSEEFKSAEEEVTEKNTTGMKTLERDLEGAKKARELGNTVKQLKDELGFNDADIIGAGYSVAELKAGGYNASTLLQHNKTPAELKEGGFTAKELREAGIDDLATLTGLNYTATDLKNANFSAEELSKYFGVKDLKTAGFTVGDLSGLYGIKDLYAGGFTDAADYKNAGFTYDRIKGYFTLGQLAKAGYEEAINLQSQQEQQRKLNEYNTLLDRFMSMGSWYSPSSIKQLLDAGKALNKTPGQVGEDLGMKGLKEGIYRELLFGKTGAYNGLHEFNWGGSSGVSYSDINAIVDGIKRGYNKRLSNLDPWERDRLRKIGIYKTGGLNTTTGPAWLDGTPSKPELVLNSTDTKNFLALRDVLSKAMGSTKSINNSYGGDNIFEININVDKIEKDYDVDRVADRVKKKILESSSYRNVTQVRNFR